MMALEFFSFWLAMVAVVFWLLETHRQVCVRGALEHWTREGQTIHAGPIFAESFGDSRPKAFYGLAAGGGALGIVDDTLRFYSPVFHYRIPLHTIRWIGFRVTRVNQKRRVRALVLHCQDFEWRVLEFFPKRGAQQLAEYISEACDLPVHDVPNGSSESYGPAVAQRVTQDIYGQWGQRTATDNLLLAPDHLIFGRSYMPLSYIKRVGVIHGAGLLHSVTPFPRDLLRIEYETAQGTPTVVGFLVRDAVLWMYALKRHNERIKLMDSRRKPKGKSA